MKWLTIHMHIIVVVLTDVVGNSDSFEEVEKCYTIRYIVQSLSFPDFTLDSFLVLKELLIHLLHSLWGGGPLTGAWIKVIRFSMVWP